MTQSQVPTVRVVVNGSVPAKTMTVNKVKRIFSMRQIKWANGQPIKVYVLVNQHETHKIFSTSILGMFPYQLDRIWNKLVYSGLGEEPIKLDSEQAMLEQIAQQPGAIGYIMQHAGIDTVNVIEVVQE
jgi:ABC-type phosphate transport system substrate-binding protein